MKTVIKGLLWGMVASAIAILPGHAFDRDLYLSGRIATNFSNVDDVTVNDGGSMALVDDAIEFVAAGGVAIGFDWRDRFSIPLRTEIAYRYRYHFDHETETPSAVFYDSSTKAGHGFTLNVWVPWAVSERFDLVAGAGAGIFFHETQSIRRNGSSEEVWSDTTNFTWRVGVGALYHLAPSWTLESYYSYQELGEIVSGPFSGGDAVDHDRYYTHEFIAGIAYNF
jgi:opacity protein-like surface antigen